MPICIVCGKTISNDETIYCCDCGRPLCADCGSIGLCPSCEEVWESEEDLIDEDDKGNVIGTSKSVDDVYKMIHDNCDSPPTKVKVEEKEIMGNTLLIVEVPEGDNKPYQSKRTKQWYIRHNANDMIMERSELLEIYQMDIPFI